jgi:HlyD family secretion protein
MEKMKRILLFSAVTALILFLAIAAFVNFHKSGNPNELVLYGNVDVRQVDIGFRVSGRVNTLFYEEGDFVPMGSLMALLDKTPYDSQIVAAEANVKASEASFANAEVLLSRRKEAVQIGGVSKEDFDDALFSRNEWYANVEAAKAALAVAKDNMNYTQVFAPTDGIILSRIREPGTVVNPTEPIYTLSVSSPVWIRAYVDETDLGKIYYGQEAKIYTDGHEVYTGKIGFISPTAEFTPKTVETAKLRTDLVYRLRIYADNPNRYLKQGMPVTVKLRIS